MKIVIFGLTVSSSWGNGHATLWRALIGALARQGHAVTFYERDAPYYAEHRDLTELPYPARLVLYGDWSGIAAQAQRNVDSADAVIVTSYCPDACSATELALHSRAAVKAFYDLDTPVTLSQLDSGRRPAYLPADGLGGFDVVLSYTGGEALDALANRLGARRAVPIYGSVDPSVHYAANPRPEFAADLSYLGTYAPDRQAALNALFLQPACQMPHQTFVIGGAQYPQDFPWSDNIHFVRHLPPSDHPAFFCSSRLTLNVTRAAMAKMGYCPSGRLFEAAACGVPIITDPWEGLEQFYEPGTEILVADGTDDVIAALKMPEEALREMARRAQARTLTEHTGDNRARELVSALKGSSAPAMLRQEA